MKVDFVKINVSEWKLKNGLSDYEGDLNYSKLLNCNWVTFVIAKEGNTFIYLGTFMGIGTSMV